RNPYSRLWLWIPGSLLVRRPRMTAVRIIVIARSVSSEAIQTVAGCEILDCFAYARNDGRASCAHVRHTQIARRAVFACAVGQITPMLARVPPPIRGAYRDRHGRWLRDAMDAVSHETNEHIAYGEVVWS